MLRTPGNLAGFLTVLALTGLLKFVPLAVAFPAGPDLAWAASAAPPAAAFPAGAGGLRAGRGHAPRARGPCRAAGRAGA